jgi:hypothetical protein
LRHKELSEQQEYAEYRTGHKILMVVQFIPGIGLLAVLIERIVVYVASKFKQGSKIENNEEAPQINHIANNTSQDLSDQTTTKESPNIDANQVENVNKENNLKQTTLENPVSNITSSQLNHIETKVLTGFGEFIVFRVDKIGSEITKETYEKVYEIFQMYSPQQILSNNSNGEEISKAYANRHKLISTKVKEIDNTLEIAFVPRTLYELIFLRKCIREDAKRDRVCPLLTTTKGGLAKILTNYAERDKCWHLSYFKDSGDDRDANVKELAHRLNRIIVKTLSPQSEGFTLSEFHIALDKEIAFFQNYYKECQKITEEWKNDTRDYWIISSVTHSPGPAVSFGYDLNDYSPNGIRDDKDAKIVKKVLDLDCSKIAQTCLFLYRGSDYEKDKIFSEKNSNIPYSISYGTSLFAGSVYDPGASVFCYARTEENTHAIPIPLASLKSPKMPFHVPATNAICQLTGHGEHFHGRSKVWRDCDMKIILGIWGLADIISQSNRNYLKSDLSKEDLIKKFDVYKKKAIILK